MSYSHDDDHHRDWVAALAGRLRANGVDVCLDRWDVALGGNLALFMERAANAAYRVVAIVSATYARKADEREGGAGVEAQMLSARLYADLDEAQVIPVIRNNPANPPRLPAYLSGRRWIDFRDDKRAEDSYEELLRDLRSAPVDAAPPLGANPFDGKSDTEARLEIRNAPARWHSPGLTGNVEFVYAQNSGRYMIGSGLCQFTLDLGVRGPDTVYVLNDPADIKHVAVISRLRGREVLLSDVSQFNTSSRVVDAGIGDAIILHNKNGYWAVVMVTAIFGRRALDDERVIRFQYWIRPDRAPDFSGILVIDTPA
ncbi:MAG: toll/interleukin-1 receptor domain-containing protein [Bifidobacteriaceae bacterium]|jgi:hypothetical protein|nr:toll/interleukin-1 receptor domain-containing protein [Bifidobacteriaceae bacterium]